MTSFMDFATGILPLALGAVLSALVTWLISMRQIPAAYRVAVIGFPRSGKTTLITALFAYLFRRGVHGASIVPRGDETIRRINTDIAKLELHEELGATTDQEVFAYRADIQMPWFLVKRRYKFEIGDFPGEKSEALGSEQEQEWLHNSDYFKWAVSADAFLFIIDSSKVLSPAGEQYVAKQKSALRAAWQQIRGHYLDGPSDIRRRPVVLVFTKLDLVLESHPHYSISAARAINANASPHGVTAEQIKQIARKLEAPFAELSDYFRNESRRFAIVFTSVYTDHIDGGDRLGIPTLARYLMPKSSYWPTASR